MGHERLGEALLVAGDFARAQELGQSVSINVGKERIVVDDGKKRPQQQRPLQQQIPQQRRDPKQRLKQLQQFDIQSQDNLQRRIEKQLKPRVQESRKRDEVKP